MKKQSVSSLQNWITYGVVAVAYGVIMLLGAFGALSSTFKGLLVPVCAYIIVALSLNLTVGILGELSLGHAGFMSVGAFAGVTAAQALEGAIPSDPLRMIVAIAVGAVFAALVGVLIGIPVLRLGGDYLAIVTLAFGEIIKSIFNNLYVGMDTAGLHISFINNTVKLGADGRMLINGAMGISGIRKISTFTAGFVLIMLALVIIFNLVNSRPGRAIRAIRDNRIAAESVGLNITKYKMMAFVTSAAIAGVSGTLFAMNFSTIVANKFDFNTSILILVFVVLGGQGNMLGSIIAAAALTILPEALREFADYRMLVYAIVLIVVMLATNNPRIRALLDRARAAFGGKKGKEAVSDGN